MNKLNDIKRGREIGQAPSSRFIWQACVDCGKERWVQLCGGGKPNSIRCISCAQVKRQPPSARSVDRFGYTIVTIGPDSPFYGMTRTCKGRVAKKILEHRLLMAQHLSRPLGRSEIVHHKNGDKSDNRIENLALSSEREHTQYHREVIKALDILQAQNETLLKRIKLLEFQLKQSGAFIPK